MGRIIGIDLGTTNTLACCWDGEKSVLIPNRFGEYLTPSVVCVDSQGMYSVGKAAKERLLTDPEHCARDFKRFMGTERKFKLGKEYFSVEQLSAMVLKVVREDAEAFLGEPVEEAVISVPAYFGDKARRATRKAGLLAGLKVERIVNEPSAAALAYRYIHGEIDGHFLVFDFGGGTLDVSLVDCFENIVEISAVCGDNRLGGMDFDLALATFFCGVNLTLYHDLDKPAQQAVLACAEQAKRVLTVRESTEMQMDDPRFPQKTTITRRDFLRLCAPLFMRIGKPIQQVLRDGKVSPMNLNGVVMVGGSCKMPVVQDYLQFALKGKAVEAIHPDAMVALGVGVYAGMKEKHTETKDLILTDICPFSLGTDVLNPVNKGKSLMSVLIPRNSTLPTSRVASYNTASDNQKAIDFGIYQGEDMYAENNQKLGSIYVDQIPPGPAGQEKIVVRYTYDINGILFVDLRVVSTGKEHHLLLGADDEDEKIKEQVAALDQYRREAKYTEEQDLLLARAESIFRQLNSEEARSRLAAGISRMEEVKQKQSPYAIRTAMAELSEMLDELERDYLEEYIPEDSYYNEFLRWYDQGGNQQPTEEEDWDSSFYS